jgi:hypothetical protein
MVSDSLHRGATKQGGLVLLALVIVIALAFISYVISDLSVNQMQSEQAAKTQLSLKKAKQALINYAVSHMDRPGDEGEMGFLPCPDEDPPPPVTPFDEGKQELNCGTQYVNSIGYLPWKSLDIPSLRDSSGNCLLYAVSNTYKLNPHNLLNDDSHGMFQVVDASGAVKVGLVADDRPVAIVFAPGKPLAGQSRSFTAGTDCGMDYDMSDFLEGNGGTNNGVLSAIDNSIDQFIHMTAFSASAVPPYNDKFITISRDDIWSAIMSRNDFVLKMKDLTEALAMCLAEYANSNGGRRLPWPAPMNRLDKDYRKDINYNDKNGGLYAGRYPFVVDDSNTALSMTSDNIFDTGDVSAPTGTKCDALSLTSGNIANLSDDAKTNPAVNAEYRRLWENWKDHFFYILSREYKPATGGPKKCGDCNEVDSKKYSAIVIFSGTKFGPDVREDRLNGDDDDKSNIFNYIENNNEAVFNSADGKDHYYKVGADSNDIMFCVTDEDIGKDLKAEPC